ncbi:hypothetical protein B7486_06680 [cyanobacterium TDX16]|nr:hypothetical protein B7486_06680 [cyanobacterium TDX16]
MSMFDAPLIRNPLGWAQLMLLGGWKRLGAVAALTAAGIIVCSMMIYRAVNPNLSSFAQSAVGVLMMCEAVLLFFIASGQIKKALLRDFTTDMITSHRLSAMSGYTAVFGYVTGPITQILSMSAVIWVAMHVFISMVTPGVGAGRAAMLAIPSVLYAIMLCAAATLWSLGVLIGLSTRGKAGVIGVVVFLAISNNTSMFKVVPGLYVLFPLTEIVTNNIATAGSIAFDAPALLASGLIQTTLTLVFVIAAARKFHRDDVPAFTPILAHILLAICSLTCAVAFKYWRPSALGVIRVDFAIDPGNQMLMTLASLALLSLLPVAVGASSEARWAKRAAADAQFAPRRPTPFYASAASATAIALGIMLVVTGKTFHGQLKEVTGLSLAPNSAMTMALAFFLAMVTMSGLLRYCYGIGMGGLTIGSFAIALLWLAPLLAEAAWAVLMDRHSSQEYSMLFTMSPIGTWAAVLKKLNAPVTSGLAVQGAFAVGALMLAHRVRRRVRLATAR